MSATWNCFSCGARNVATVEACFICGKKPLRAPMPDPTGRSNERTLRDAAKSALTFCELLLDEAACDGVQRVMVGIELVEPISDALHAALARHGAGDTQTATPAPELTGPSVFRARRRLPRHQGRHRSRERGEGPNLRALLPTLLDDGAYAHRGALLLALCSLRSRA